MTTFNKGDIVTSKMNPEFGKGEVWRQDRHHVHVRFEGYHDYLDEPDDPDFHFMEESDLVLAHQELKYDPSQQGDDDDSI